MRVLVRSLLRRFGFVHMDRIRRAERRLVEFRRYAERSGHLTSAYKSGRRIRAMVDDVRAELHGVSGYLPPEVEDAA